MYIFPVVAKVVVKLTRSNLDNIVDRAHYFFTFAVLVLCALFNAGELLFGSPIMCMNPMEYSSEWGYFVNEYCFINGTYVGEGGGYMPDASHPNKIDVSYYQWFGYVLFLQCLMFYGPHFIWSSLQGLADVDMLGVVDRCVELRTQLNPVEKRGNINGTVTYLKKILDKRRNGDYTFGDGLGDWGTLYYMGSKCFNLLNVLFQFYMINRFVGRGRLDWGFKVLHDAANGIFWNQNGFFPRLSYCEFPRDDLADQTIREAYCVLMLNMINEKIFTVLYFWFLALFVVTLIDLVHSLAIYTFDGMRLHEGKRYLKNVQQLAPDALVTSETKNAFVLDVLGRDGLLLLRFVESHAGILVASQVACRLFEVVNTRPGDNVPEVEIELEMESELKKPSATVLGDMI